MHILNCMLTGFNFLYPLILLSGTSRRNWKAQISKITADLMITICILISLLLLLTLFLSVKTSADMVMPPSDINNSPRLMPPFIRNTFLDPYIHEALILESQCEVLFPRVISVPITLHLILWRK